MKKVLLAAAMTMMSVSAFAQYNSCEAEMTDRRGRTLEVMRAYDCQEAMKQCRTRINDLRMRGVYDCRRIDNSRPIPGPQNPYPNPYPDTNPYPGPQTGYDSTRMLNQGESAVYRNQIVTVIGASYSGSYAVRANDVWNTITNGVRRDELSVMNGCNLRLCTSDSVINISTATFVKVIALSSNNTFVTQAQDVWNTIASNVDRSRLADTKGCINSRYAQICVGNQVINNQNRYSTVVGIQQDGRVVLKASDVWNTITPNVDPLNLIITR